MEEDDEMIMICPRCNEFVETIYKDGKLNVTEKCSCFDEIGFENWVRFVRSVWDDMTIIKTSSVDVEDIKEEVKA